MVAVGELEDEAAAAGAADRRDLNSGGVGPGEEGEQAIVADGGDVDALVLGEEGGGCRPARGLLISAPTLPASAISASATARPPSATSWQAVIAPPAMAARTNSPAERSAARSTGGGGPSSRPWISRSQSDWPRWPRRSPIVTMTSPTPLKPMPTALRQSLSRPTPPMAGVGRMALPRAVLALGLVVERDVAADDREVEGAAGLGHAFDAADELAHDLGPLRVAEIHAVGGRERGGADRAEVAIGLGDRLLAALEGVGEAIARGDVGGDGERLAGAVDPDHRGSRRPGAGRCRRRPCGHIAPRSSGGWRGRARPSARAGRRRRRCIRGCPASGSGFGVGTQGRS